MKRTVLPPTKEYFMKLFEDDTFRNFLKNDATKDGGMDVVAEYCKVEQDWDEFKRIIWMHKTRAEKHFLLLVIVKTKNDVDNVLVNFIEGLHRHTAILFCLTCSYFDCIDNEIKQATMKMKHFKTANIPHFKQNKRTPIAHVEDFLNDKYPADMLIKCFQVQAFYPTQICTDVTKLMETLHMNSGWISNNEKKSTDKTMSMLLPIAIKEILKYSTRIQQDNMSPWPAHHFVYQKDTTALSYQKVYEKENSDMSYKYCSILSSDPWREYIKDLLHKEKTKAY